MSDIVKFLRARLDEDEALARAAIDPDRPGTHWHWWRADERDRPAAPDEGTGGEVKTGPALHIARHDPTRALREVEAKRQVIGLHPEILSICQSDGEAFPCRTLEALVDVYADHPDYDAAWA